MSEEKKINDQQESGSPEQLSLNDDRRVKVLSPGTLVAKRFFRNRLAVVGLTILAVMFVFSFIGGLISPYGQDEVFYRDDIQLKEYAAMSENTEYRYLVADGQEFGTILQAQLTLHMGKDDSFSYKGVTYDVTKECDSLYSVSSGGRLLAIAYKDIISSSDPSQKFGFNFSFNALKAHANGEAEFTANGKTYTLDEDSVMLNGEEIAYISRFVIQSKVSGTVISKDFKERVQQAVENGKTKYTYVNDAGQEREIKLEYNPAKYQWSIKEGTSTRVFDAYSFPSSAHWLGTDKNGMDMLTRLMYGGRVSLMIGFIVVIISAALGVVLGGVSGYFGGWVDNLIMRIVDIFYCIPSTPLIIILGAAMDGMRVDPQIRMLYLMLILGFLGWPGIARLVRGQILSLREQEFMTATEACGISVSRRIFRHLIPNVIPQLIVNCTMSLGSTIITEATLSFLGLGVKFPFASWGNIMNDVSNSYVLTSYWFIWIPAGVLLLLNPTAEFKGGTGKHKVEGKEEAKAARNNMLKRYMDLLLPQKKLFAYAILSSVILTLIGIVSTVFNKAIMDEVLPYGLKSLLISLIVVFSVVNLTSTLLSTVRQWILIFLSIKIDIPLMLGYFEHVYKLPMKFFASRKTGEITTRYSDASTIKSVFTSIALSLIMDISMAIITGIILFNFGTGPIRGFATTLIIGILVSCSG